MDPNQKDEAQRIWEELDAADSGQLTEEAVPSQEATEHDDTATQDEAAQAAQTETAEDPYEGLPSRVKDELIGLKSIVEQLTGRVRNTEGHIGGLKSQLAERVKVAEAVKSTGAAAPSAAQLAAAQTNPEAYEQLRKDYPEFASGMEALVDHKARTIADEVTQRLRSESQSLPREEFDRALAEAKAEIEREMRVEVRHPGWKDRVQSAEFRGWYAQQAKEVQSLGASEDPSDAVRLLDLFEESRGRKADRQTRLQAAAALPSGRAQSVRVKPVDEMTPEEFWAYLDQKEARKG